MPPLQPRHLVLKAGSPPGRNGVDVASEIPEFRLVLAVVGRFVGAHSGDQCGLAIRVIQGQIGSLSQIPLVVTEREVIQHVWLDHIIAVQAIVFGIAEFLEGFGERPRNRSDQLIAVEVLAAEQCIKAQLLAHVIIALDRVDPLILARRAAAVDGERSTDPAVLCGKRGSRP